MQAPAKANSAIGVKVEGGPKGCIYVKVHCADRRGLLADIIAALKSMPLEVCNCMFHPKCHFPVGFELVEAHSLHRSQEKHCSGRQGWWEHQWNMLLSLKCLCWFRDGMMCLLGYHKLLMF